MLREACISTAAALLLLASQPGCKDDAQEARPNEVPKASPEPAETPTPTEVQERPLDPAYVPTEALGGLEGLALDAQPPCSETIATLGPALEGIAEAHAKLAKATTEAEVTSLLSALSTTLATQRASIAARTETDELRRISDEVSASIGDLAETLELASEALKAHELEASSKAKLRLQNGISNTRSSIERLIDQCAL